MKTKTTTTIELNEEEIAILNTANDIIIDICKTLTRASRENEREIGLNADFEGFVTHYSLDHLRHIALALSDVANSKVTLD